jgi:hypothetical protein
MVAAGGGRSRRGRSPVEDELGSKLKRVMAATTRWARKNLAEERLPCAVGDRRRRARPEAWRAARGLGGGGRGRAQQVSRVVDLGVGDGAPGVASREAELGSVAGRSEADMGSISSAPVDEDDTDEQRRCRESCAAGWHAREAAARNEKGFRVAAVVGNRGG